MRCLSFLLKGFLFLFCFSVMHADTILVPAQSPTIQEGINAAVNGDTVMVSPGVYNEWAIDFWGKAIVVMSTDPYDPAIVASTIVDGNQQYSVFIFQRGEDITSVLAGFTIRNGRANQGGGVRCNGGSATITRNVITENRAEMVGGGVVTTFSQAIVAHNQITNNVVEEFGGDGGGIRIYYAQPVITNNIISGNTASRGGGILASGDSTPIISENTVTNNDSWHGGGIYCDFAANVVVTNTILWGNTADEGPAIYMASDPEYYPNNVLSISYSTVEGGLSGVFLPPWDVLNWGDGMLDTIPDFSSDGYHLNANSPLRNAGDPDFTAAGEMDIDGNSRVLEERVDIGVDEIKVMKIRDQNPPVIIQSRQEK